MVASYQVGRVQALVDVSGVLDFSTGNAGQHFEIHPGAGISIAAVGELRFGAEVYSEASLDTNQGNTVNTWVIVGPDMSWTHGRFWMSAVYGFGVANIRDAPRVIWGIAF
jgi:hypothetical protein